MLVRLDTSGPKVNVCHSVVKELDNYWITDSSYDILF